MEEGKRKRNSESGKRIKVEKEDKVKKGDSEVIKVEGENMEMVTLSPKHHAAPLPRE